MPSNTKNLNLYKKNPQTDGEDTFNIETMINENLDKIDAEFDASAGHKHTGAAGDGPKLTSASYAGGSVTDAAMGTRTADPTTATAYGLVGSITQWFSWITKYFKTITGKANPFDAPDITLAATKTHVDDTTRHITAAERTAWNAAETNAKNASIPMVQKGAASGVPAMDAAKYMLGDGISLKEFSIEAVSTFSFTHNVANQKVDLITTGSLAGFFEVTITGTFGNQNNVGRMTKRFNIMTNTSGTINSQLTQYTEVTGPIVNCVSISDVSWDATSSQWRITIEARTSNGNGYAVHTKRLTSQSALNTKPFTLGTPYTGTAATTLPVAVQAIPDDTVTQSGYLLQKHKLTENDGKVIRLVPNTDLNTVNRNGQYDGYPLVNAPGGNTGAWFFIEVFSHSQSPDTIFFQRATTFATVPRTHIRECYNSVWGAWIETEATDRKNAANGYAGLDASAFVPDARIAGNIARKAVEIPANEDLNNYTAEGEYYAFTSTIAATLGNRPTSISFHLRVAKHNGISQTVTTFGIPGTGELSIYMRNKYQATWGAWEEVETSRKKNVASGYGGLDTNAKLPRVNTYNSLGGSPNNITNLDTLLTAGTYSVNNTASGNPATGDYGQVLVHVSNSETHDSSSNWIWQMFYGTTGGTFVRRKINNGAWVPWVPMWTGYNDALLFMTRATLANSTDLNTLVVNGIYSIYQPTGISNMPPTPVTYGILTVSKTDASINYLKQEITDVTTGVKWSRIRGSSVWTPWVSDITSAGGTMEALLTRKYSGTSYKYTNLASYSLGGPTTGTMKITLPVGWTAAMMRIKISGYEYTAGKGAWELLLGGYNFTTGWAQVTANITGNAPFTSVRFAYDGAKCCILLGGVTTAWNFPSIEVSEVLAGHTGASGLGGNWSVSPITVETGITNILTPVLNQVGSNADTLGGYSAAQVTQGTLAYAVTTGTAPTLVATFNPAVAALSAGLRVTIKAHAATTGPVTLNVNGLGAKSIKKPNGNNPPLALGGVYTVVYDGTAFILQGEGGEYGTATAADVIAGKTIGTEGGLIDGAIVQRGAADGYTPAVSAAWAAGGGCFVRIPSGAYLKTTGIGNPEIRVTDPNVVPANWLRGVSMFGQDGAIVNRSTENNNSPAQEIAVWLPGMANNPVSIIHLRPQTGYFNGSSWVSYEVPDLLQDNIRVGKAIGGVQGTLKPWFGGLTSVNFATQAGQDGRTEEIFRFPAGFTMAAFSGAILFGTSNNNSYQDHSLVLQDNQGNKLLLVRHVTNGNNMSITQQITGLIIDGTSRRITMPKTQYLGGFDPIDINADGSFSKPFNLQGEVKLIHVVVSSLGGGYSWAQASGVAVWN